MAPNFSPSTTDLLIIGAGPAGLMAACWASQYTNMTTRIIDKYPSRTATGHADGIQSRSLEILESFGVVDPIIRKGVQHAEMCFWGYDKHTGGITRHKMDSAQTDKSRYNMVLLNQGIIEQIILDYLGLEQGGRVEVEYGKQAETLELLEEGEDEYPVVVGVKRVGQNGANGHCSDVETIRARYVIGCDGARSWTREQLQVPMRVCSGDTTWGVVDIAPITDFPDIRQSCAIHAGDRGSIMTAPRENRLVRFYIYPKGDGRLSVEGKDRSEVSLDEIVGAMAKVMKPYSLTYKHCDWWSIYKIGQRLVETYRPHDRIFLAGDAAHTHSPKGGQGLNVSMQDTYNLTWKLCSVITGEASPSILDTYELERRPVGEQLLKLDTELVKAYEQDTSVTEGVERVRGQYIEFMTGTGVTYDSNDLIAGKKADTSVAKNIKIGMRLSSYPVVAQADGISMQLVSRLTSNGAWRLLVFPGDLLEPSNQSQLANFANQFNEQPHLSCLHKNLKSTRCCPLLETIVVHSSPRTSVNLLDLPDIFHPFDETWGWDYSRVFADDGSYGEACGHAYEEYGIREENGCLVLCRPDQHVAWLGSLGDVEALDQYFGQFVGRK
ncbi:FAD binding domain protein [Aspergillus neoniger CBS 115656]|uniref:FAD binding domain protein n=1 Tax=Aspergillus neoniger (strain CBS 115656) TaxID=1448310 RepID=A0A318YHU5_ASPNB|nr:FAD binding domain protein [Aspergillus neoniger CBS 115656]PYH33926.1 FAD binding domain protein [Aspergillus neoniger CBS 115656]